MMGWGEEACCGKQGAEGNDYNYRSNAPYGSQRIHDHMQPSTGLVYGQSRIYNYVSESPANLVSPCV